MGLKKVVFSICLVHLLLMTSTGYSAWMGPVEIMSGMWGSSPGQFGLRDGDSGDDFPEIDAITLDGKLIIGDIVNKKQIVFGLDGSFIKEVKWVIKSQSSGITYYDISEYSFERVIGYSSDGNIFTGSGNKYFLKSSTGQLIKTYTERPLELGKVSEKTIGVDRTKITVKYPDKTFSFVGLYERYVRDAKANLNAISGKFVKKINECGKELGRLSLPSNQSRVVSPGGKGTDEVTELIEEFGQPVIAPNGDVYAWKRTPDKHFLGSGLLYWYQLFFLIILHTVET